LLSVTAGLVTASIFTDLSPTLCKIEGNTKLQRQALIGVIIGTTVMIFLKYFDKTKNNSKSIDKKFNYPLVLSLALAADVFIDGLVIGQSLASNKPSIGFISAMGLEGILTSSTLSNIIKDRGGSNFYVVLSSGIMIFSNVIGVTIGKYFAAKFKDKNGLPSPGKVKIIGAALVVLLWTVCIELIPEAVSENDKIWVYASWLLSTAGGLSLDWYLDYMNK
jgi:zinc transporter ZupT